ncbi:Ger(x)C family spore germination C-terminal domain-containing protein [Paenibacillus ehimensis]|uniref:Ger(X)C family spore germination C-terminal domain-containing protein n=2 Tax=Paenibacillus ehimensis TaxID=79264 RepID=A0ABT8V908_9BACL|nr:Ger(x)C family spore germination C-terminal domain-containing protein [Paenibacillus ehimensis]MDO3677197.1 Ger(x)C family spore germination C-terminal domain-containing protein [Paenibacillus ehimensis]
MNEYEKALENEVNTAVKRLIRKLISRGVDPIGFGLRYRADRTTTEEEWRRWQAGYRGLPVEVSTRVHIEGTGVLK